MAYVLLWRRLERYLLNQQLIAGFARAMGNEQATMPDLLEARASFDEWLNAPPPERGPRDIEQLELMAALGVG